MGGGCHKWHICISVSWKVTFDQKQITSFIRAIVSVLEIREKLNWRFLILLSALKITEFSLTLENQTFTPLAYTKAYACMCTRASLVAQLVKSPPAMQETWVWSLGREGPLENGMATHSSILTWRIPWTEEPGRLQSMGLQRVGHSWATFFFFFNIPKEASNPLLFTLERPWRIDLGEEWARATLLKQFH